jgi:hypothetical protein
MQMPDGKDENLRRIEIVSDILDELIDSGSPLSNAEFRKRVDSQIAFEMEFET